MVQDAGCRMQDIVDSLIAPIKQGNEQRTYTKEISKEISKAIRCTRGAQKRKRGSMACGRP